MRLPTLKDEHHGLSPFSGGFHMKRLLAPFLTVSLSFLIVLFFFSPVVAIEAGAPAPDFELKTLEGKKVRLSDYKGQIILLKLATTWCPTCRQQTEEIKEAGKFLAAKNVIVVDVFLQDSEKMVREYLEGEDLQVPFVALLDDGSAHKAYNVYLIPRVLLIDGNFNVRRDGSLLPARELIKQVQKITGES
jgi:peroxiredoxin